MCHTVTCLQEDSHAPSCGVISRATSTLDTVIECRSSKGLGGRVDNPKGGLSEL
jgi:hypothetical protein